MIDREEDGLALLRATLHGNLWQRWCGHMRIIGSPWVALKLAWRHKAKALEQG